MLRHEIVKIIYDFNWNKGIAAKYEDVLRKLPEHYRTQTVERLMRKMVEEGILKRPYPGAYVVPAMVVTKELGDFVRVRQATIEEKV